MIVHLSMGVAAALALIYGAGYCWRECTDWPRSLVKTGSVALLALAGFWLGAPSWVVAGLALGAVGDFWLSRPGVPAFLVGMAAFAAGHLAYAWGFFGLADGARPHGLIAALWVLAATTEVWLAPRTGALRWPVRGYVVVITVMGVAALCQPVPLLHVGAGLFIVSDVLLALVLFVVPQSRWRRVLAIALWLAYWSGQFLILQGALVANSAA